MRVTRVRAENFRGIRDLDLAIPAFGAVVGPNGAGKSTLLELLNIFGRLEDAKGLVEVFVPWGGYRASTYYGAKQPRIALGITASTDCISAPENQRELVYDLELFGELNSFYVRAERLVRLEADEPRILLDRGGQSIATGFTRPQIINQRSPEIDLPSLRSLVADAGDFLAGLHLTSLWKAHRFDPDGRVRYPQPLHPVTTPQEDGSDLLSALYALKTSRRPSFDELLEILQQAIPEVHELEFPLAGAGHVYLEWRQSNHSQPFYIQQLSDGMLRFLWIVTILQTVPDDGLVLIDEPELSLHPQWLMLLSSILRKTAARTSVLVATQSPELIRWLEPDELIIADLTEHGTTFTPAKDKADLDRWLKDFTLSELWTMGELGGRR